MAFLLTFLALAAPVAIESESNDLSFGYRWSSEAQAVPELAQRFRSDAAMRKAEMLRMAAAEKASTLR